MWHRDREDRRRSFYTDRRLSSPDKRNRRLENKTKKAMKYLKLYENFDEEENLPGSDIPFDANTGADTSWTADIGGKKVTITLGDINVYLDENRVPVEEIDAESIEDILIKTDRDPNRVESADLDFPIIVSKFNGNFYSVLDGQHRAVKSIQNNIPTIKARILDLNSAPEEYRKMFIR